MWMAFDSKVSKHRTYVIAMCNTHIVCTRDPHGHCWVYRAMGDGNPCAKHTSHLDLVEQHVLGAIAKTCMSIHILRDGYTLAVSGPIDCSAICEGLWPGAPHVVTGQSLTLDSLNLSQILGFPQDDLRVGDLAIAIDPSIALSEGIAASKDETGFLVHKAHTLWCEWVAFMRQAFFGEFHEVLQEPHTREAIAAMSSIRLGSMKSQHNLWVAINSKHG